MFSGKKLTEMVSQKGKDKVGLDVKHKGKNIKTEVYLFREKKWYPIYVKENFRIYLVRKPRKSMIFGIGSIEGSL